MDKYIFDIIRTLPNPDIQLDRAIYRHDFHCPECGKLCHVNYHMLSSRSKGMYGMTTGCSECGETRMTATIRNGKEVWKMEDTGAIYDPNKYLDDLERLYLDADTRDIMSFSKRCEEYANELKLFTDNDELIYPIYQKEMSVLLEHLKRTGPKDLVFVCERTFDCNSIAKYDLLSVMREVYSYALNFDDKLPPSLEFALMLEKEILDYAFDNMFYDDLNEHIEQLLFIADCFEDLSDDERADRPYVAVNCHQYAFKSHQRDRASDKKLNSDAKALIASVKRARQTGAPIDTTIMKAHISAYMHLLATQKTAAKAMMKDAAVWDDHPFFKGVAYVVYADYLYRKAFDMDPMCPISAMDQKTIDEISLCASKGIEALETLDDIENIAIWLPLAYYLNGYVSDRSSDIKLAFNYVDLFLKCGLVDREDAKYVLQMIATSTPIGSSLQKKAFKLLGYGGMFF